MRNKFLIVAVVFGLIVSSLNASYRSLTKKELIDLKKSSKSLNKRGLTIKEGMDRGNSYFLKLETKTKRGSRLMNAFVDKVSGDVYFGKGYTKDGKPISFPKDTEYKSSKKYRLK
jgi:hypothetical protein